MKMHFLSRALLVSEIAVLLGGCASEEFTRKDAQLIHAIRNAGMK